MKTMNKQLRRFNHLNDWLVYLTKSFLGLVILLGSAVYAADSPQYGTPFSGVPDPRDASIYQVNIRSFSSTRNLQGVINRLDQIKALGVNVIQLMPIQPVSTAAQAINSPYAWKDMAVTGGEYGNLTTLRALTDGAHARGMAVIMDWVANQTGWDHPWITQHKDWYVQNSSGQIQTLNGWADVAALNMANTTMRAAQIQIMRDWIFKANIDGFRCDYANNYLNFWGTLVSNLHGISGRKILMVAEGDGSGLYGKGFDVTFSWNFYNNIKAIHNSGSSVSSLIASSNTFDYSGASGSQQVTRWLTNHDIYGTEGSPFNIFGGKSGVLANFVITAYMRSIPFIYNGMEVGNTVAMPFPFKSSVINWTQDVSVTPEITKILAHRKFSNAIRRGALTMYNTSDVCIFKKTYNTETVFVMSNLRNAGKTVTLPAGIANTTMYNAYTNAAVGLTGNYYLAPYQWVVLKVGAGSREGVEDEEISPAVDIYPNPNSDKQLNFAFNGIEGNEIAAVTVTDVNGKLALESQTALSSKISHNLSAGLYFVNIRANGINVTKKLVVD